MLLAASVSAINFSSRPYSDDLLAVQYDSKNGVYRYAMPGPTENDARLAQSKTDSGMLESSKAAIEEFGSIWEPELEVKAPAANGSGAKGWGNGLTHHAQMRSKDVVAPDGNFSDGQAPFVNKAVLPE
jgi:hypothetical protein